ncbi:MAG: hypothetical protein AB1556_16935 [Bacillota bacterium]
MKLSGRGRAGLTCLFALVFLPAWGGGSAGRRVAAPAGEQATAAGRFKIEA